MDENEIGREPTDAAVKVPRALGPGLLETVYEIVLARELENRGLKLGRQIAIPIEYDGFRFDEGFRGDIIIEGEVILELKSVEQLNNVHRKQLFTYMKLSGVKLGFLLNFGAPLMEDGIVRIVNGLDDENLGVCA